MAFLENLQRLSSSGIAMVLALSASITPAESQGSGAGIPHRLVQVEDAIRMSRLAAPDEAVAAFSPDGSRFAVLTKRGDLDRNTNDFSLLLYRTVNVLQGLRRYSLFEMSSSSNRDAIKEINWLDDNRTIVFLGERAGSLPQVYSMDVQTMRLHQLTHSPNAIHSYEISQNGLEIVYVTDQPKATPAKDDGHQGLPTVVEGRRLSEFLSRTCETGSNWPRGEQLYVQHGAEKPVLVPVPEDYIADWSRPLSISPDGRYCLVGTLVREIPSIWDDYQDERVRLRVRQAHRRGEPVLFLERYLLLDTKQRSVKPLLNTPMTQFAQTRWSKDSSSIFLKDVLLPLDVADPSEREKRTRKTYEVEVEAATGKLWTVEGSDWPQEFSGKPPLHVFLREDRNTPPKIYVSGGESDPRLLLDLNPWLGSVELAHVDVIEWQTTDGRRVKGELFFPPNYVVGRRFPLVIQTHGFAPERFLMDGPFDSSAFAAEALAARGVVVLQMDYDRSVANTTREGPTAMAAYEGAIDELDRRGLIDRERVGIIGFSRTVFQVGYALTHSKYDFRAASLVDGIDASYLQYLVFGPGDNVHVNGGPPMGDGLNLWLANSPGFQLATVRTPIRLEAHDSTEGILTSWEWYAVLSDLGRPVELTRIPDAPHIVAKPRGKLGSEREAVDWFCFWFGAETEDSAQKSEEIRRWTELRKRQDSIPVHH